MPTASPWGSGTAGLTDPDEIPEPPKEPMTKRGDLWLLGEKYRVLCGDGTDAGDVERLLDGGRPRLLVVTHLMASDSTWSGAIAPATTRGNG